MADSQPTSARTLVDFYTATRAESTRLAAPIGWLEKLRTLELLNRHLPPPPASILDVGGATGIYAAPLSEAGYRVRLLDLVPAHAAAARTCGGSAGGGRIDALLADARRMPIASDCADAVLLLGPLYHLTQADERFQAARESLRCVRPGGVLAAAAISRYASLLDGFRAGHVEDERFLPIMERDLREGQHRNPTDNPGYFTTAYFHRPGELRDELRQAGWADVQVFAVEGPAWIAPRLAGYMADAVMRERTLAFARRIESDPDIMAASAHLLAFGRKTP